MTFPSMTPTITKTSTSKTDLRGRSRTPAPPDADPEGSDDPDNEEGSDDNDSDSEGGEGNTLLTEIRDKLRASGIKSAPKFNMPEPFSGGRKGELDRFLMACTRYITFNGKKFGNKDPDTLMILWASSYFQGPVQDWYIASTEKTPKAKWLHDWDKFTEKLTTLYGKPLADKKAQESLINIRQTGSAADYVTRFQTLTTSCGFNKTALRFLFFKGLKRNVAEQCKVSLSPKRPLEEFMALAIEIDDEHYSNTTQEARTFPRRVNYANDRGNREGPDSGNWRQRPTNNRFGPNQRPRLSQEERDKRFRENRCFECGQTGHIASFHRQQKEGGTKAMVKQTAIRNTKAIKEKEETGDSDEESEN